MDITDLSLGHRSESLSHQSTSNQLSSLSSLSILREVNNIVVFHTATEPWAVSLESWSHTHVHLLQLVLLGVPDWLELHLLRTASAHATNEELLLSIIDDIITIVAQLAGRNINGTNMTSLLTIHNIINIETWASNAQSEAWAVVLHGEDVDWLSVVVEDSPLVTTASLGVLDHEQSLVTDVISLCGVGNSVSDGAAGDNHPWEAEHLLELLPAGVVVDQDNSVLIAEFAHASLRLATLVGLRLTELALRHVVINHSHFMKIGKRY